MWLELSPFYTRLAQLAAVRQFPQGMHDAALLLHSSATARFTLQNVSLLPSCGGATVGWVGAPKLFLASLAFREAALAASGAQGVLQVAA